MFSIKYIAKIFIAILIVLLSFYPLFGQDSRTPALQEKTASSYLASISKLRVDIESYNQHPYIVYYDRLIVEHKKRMKTNVRKHKVIARKMKKPQYSDPSYFGHKRKPKKRPVGKRKFCKECEIVH